LITTHVLDTARGRPAAGVPVQLERGGETVADLATDADGRARLAERAEAGRYRVVFDTGAYLGGAGFYPEVSVVFEVTEPGAHHHVPLLLSPFGYSTYRGS
jgi:5-hydroxyisourate hydrolase